MFDRTKNEWDKKRAVFVTHAGGIFPRTLDELRDVVFTHFHVPARSSDIYMFSKLNKQDVHKFQGPSLWLPLNAPGGGRAPEKDESHVAAVLGTGKTFSRGGGDVGSGNSSTFSTFHDIHAVHVVSAREQADFLRDFPQPNNNLSKLLLEPARTPLKWMDENTVHHLNFKFHNLHNYLASRALALSCSPTSLAASSSPATVDSPFAELAIPAAHETTVDDTIRLHLFAGCRNEGVEIDPRKIRFTPMQVENPLRPSSNFLAGSFETKSWLEILPVNDTTCGLKRYLEKIDAHREGLGVG